MLKLKPNNDAALRCRAKLYMRTGEHVKALQDYEHSLRLLPKDRITLQMCGHLCRKLNQPTKAINYYKSSAALGNKHPSIYLGLARCHSDLGQFHQAVDDYTTLINRIPNEPQYYVLRAEAYDRAGRHDLALKDQEKARTIHD